MNSTRPRTRSSPPHLETKCTHSLPCCHHGDDMTFYHKHGWLKKSRGWGEAKKNAKKQEKQEKPEREASRSRDAGEAKKPEREASKTEKHRIRKAKGLVSR